MRRRGRLAFGLLAVLAAVVAADAALDGHRARGSAPRAPALPHETLIGARPTAAQLRGRPLVVSFWASWCHPCRVEAPQLRRLAAAAPLGARVVAIAYDDGRAGARRFARRAGWRFPVLRDPGGRVGDRFGVIGLPTTFIVDRHGRVRAQLQGPQTVASLTRALRQSGAGA